MKYYRFFALPLSFLLLILITGCPPSGGGGGDNEDHGTAPTITDIDYYLCDNSDNDNCIESYSFSQGDYYNRRIYFTDPDLDLRYKHRTIFLKQNGQYVEYSGPLVNEIPSQNSASGSLYGINAVQITAPDGAYRFDWQLEDEEGNLSNTFRVMILVN